MGKIVFEGNRRSLRFSSNVCAVPRKRTTAAETDALALPVREFGTVCRVACEHLTSATDTLKHCWRHICLTRPQRFVTFYISALEILLFTYLLTYIVICKSNIQRNAKYNVPYCGHSISSTSAALTIFWNFIQTKPTHTTLLWLHFKHCVSLVNTLALQLA